MKLNQQDKGRVVTLSDPAVVARYKYNDIFSTAWLSHAISALAKLGVPDVIGDEPTSCADAASKLNLHGPSLYRALRAAAANGIFVHHADGKFSHNDTSRLLKSDHPYSWKGMACIWNHPSCLQGWTNFSECLKDGRSGIQHAFGKPLYEHLEEIPQGTQAFSDAMVSNSAHPSVSIAKQFPFHNYRLVMDLAGGIGTFLCAVLKEHAELTGVIFEIEELKQPAQHYIDAHGLSQRAHVQVGSFLSAVPTGPDLYMVKNSLWNWNDEQCARILRNVREACTNGGDRLLIIEYMINAENASWTTLYDLQILNMPGGRARSIEEYERLLQLSGFAIDNVQTVEDETLILAKPV